MLIEYTLRTMEMDGGVGAERVFALSVGTYVGSVSRESYGPCMQVLVFVSEREQ